MIKCQLENNAALIPDTAIYLASVAKKLGISDERSQLLCFLIESSLELRSPDLGSEDPNITIELTKNQKNIAVSITDRGIPYILSEKQKKILNNGLVDGFTFEQLGAKGQRVTFYIRLPVELIIVYINLKDPLCPDLYERLINNGYIFSGCLPGSLKGDYIILQDLRGLPMEWDRPVLAPEFRKMVDRLHDMADTIM